MASTRSVREQGFAVSGEFDRIGEYAAKLKGESPARILEWAIGRYHPRLAVVSNFGPSTVVVIHLLAELTREVPVLHINTGFEFEETAQLGRRLEERYGLRIQEIHPELTVSEQAEQYGERLYSRDPDFCCYMRKVLPLEKALANYDAWVTGVRKSQSETRRNADVVEWDARHQMVKVNPLAEWTSAQVWEFIRKHEIPYNELHDQGYPSIGCSPCTLPVEDGDDERAGRWRGLGKTECGIHLTTLTNFVSPSSRER